VNAPAVNRLILPADYCIMEVKADDRVPEWATSLLARHDCQLNRVSKYCAGVALLRDLKVRDLALSPGVPLPLDPGQTEVSIGMGPAPFIPKPPDRGTPISEPPHG
jgi:hypothetical protein